MQTGLSVAVAMAQNGDDAFMLPKVATDLGLLTADATNVLVAVAIVSIVLNPILYRTIKPFTAWVQGQPLLRRILDRSRGPEAAPVTSTTDPAHRAIVVGYGPTG